jgi:hypothetical protein
MGASDKKTKTKRERKREKESSDTHIVAIDNKPV